MGLDDWSKVPDMVDVANEVDLKESLKWLEEHWV
jgi:hypothetical protein